MALSREQRKIVRAIRREGRHIKDPKVRRIYERAAVQTGLVESNLRNLPGGDADSQGWRQERASLYPNPRNITASVRRFRQEFQQHYDRGERSYEVAAQVQRPAAQYRGRYKDRAGDAEALLRSLGDDGGGSGRRARRGSRTVTTTETIPGVDRSDDRKALQLGYLQQRGNPDALLNLAVGLRGAQDTPDKTVTRAKRVKARTSDGSDLNLDEVPARGTDPLGGKGKLIGTPHSGTHTLGNWQSDNAIDLRAPRGTPIRSTASGRVVKVVERPDGAGRFAGSQVTIRTKNNEYFYTHLSAVNVRPGQRVRRGELIGRVGSANGVPHLHLGRRKGDPRNLLRGR